MDDIIIFHALSESRCGRSSTSSCAGLVKRLEDRKIHVELTRDGEGPDHRGRLRPDLRRAAAEADDPAPDPGPAGHPRAAGGLPRRRSRAHRRQGRRSGVREGRGRIPACRTELVASAAPLWPDTPNPPAKNRRSTERRTGPRRARQRGVVRPRLPAAARARAGVLLPAAERRDDPLQRVQDARPRGQGPGSHAVRGAGPRACSRPTGGEARKPFTAVRVTRREAARGARGARREIHRRGRQPLGHRGARLGHSPALHRRRSGRSSCAAWAAPRGASCRSRAARRRSTRTTTSR